MFVKKKNDKSLNNFKDYHFFHTSFFIVINCFHGEDWGGGRIFTEVYEFYVN